MQLTVNQQRVLTTLQQAERPLGAYALLARLRGQGLRAPMQVYRALERLAAQGLVHRLETLNAYVPCNQPTCDQHAFSVFAICDECGHVDEFAEEELERCLRRWMTSNAFSLRNATIELRGRCASCTALVREGG